MQYEQQNQEHLPEYEIIIRICTNITYCRNVLTEFVVMIYICTGDNNVVDPGPLNEGFRKYAESNIEHFLFEFLLNYVRRI